ncbi:MAG: hypothetical protein ACFE9S_05780 [Candidatus Hermodarchaeota archaeon]
MIPRKIIEGLIDIYVYVYTKNISKEFAGKINSITDSDIVIIEDKNENLSYIPLSEIRVITERR